MGQMGYGQKKPGQKGMTGMGPTGQTGMPKTGTGQDDTVKGLAEALVL